MSVSTGQRTRKKLIELLKCKGELTAAALASHLDRSVAAISQHLRSCVREGLVQSHPVRRQTGRPLLLYSLTVHGAAMFGQRYEKTALEILAQAKAIGGPELVTELLTRRQEALMKPCQMQAQGMNTLDTVRLVAAKLNEDGYAAETESDNGRGIRLTIRHCPVPALAQAYPEVCRLEFESICRIAGPEASVTVCSNMSGGDSCCMYEISPVDSRPPESPIASSNRAGSP